MAVLTPTKVTATVEVARVRLKRFRHALGVPEALAIAALVFVNLLSEEIMLVLDSTDKLHAGVMASALVVVLLTVRWTRSLPGEVGPATIGNSGNAKLPTRRGVILTVGLDSADPGSAAATLFASVPAVEYVALVGTDKTKEYGVVPQLMGRVAPAVGLSVPDAHVRVWEFGNAESVSDAEQAVAEAIRWMLGRGLDVSEIVVDVSAGRRQMGYGATYAADAALVETQFVSPEWDSVLNRPVPGTHMFKILKAYH